MLKEQIMNIFEEGLKRSFSYEDVADQILSEVEKSFEECLPEKIKEEPKANVVKRSHIEIHNKLLLHY